MPPKPNEPVGIVSNVYRRLILAQSSGSDYTPSENLYTPRLRKLFEDDRKKANGEVGCIDFVFWMNGQDGAIKNLAVTRGAVTEDSQTVVAKFTSTGTPQEIHLIFRLVDDRWLLDDAESLTEPRWTLSKLLSCWP